MQPTAAAEQPEPLSITGHHLPSLENVHLGHFDLTLSRPLTHWEEKALPEGVQHLAGRLRVTSGEHGPDELAHLLSHLTERAARLEGLAREKASELDAEARAVVEGLRLRGRS